MAGIDNLDPVRTTEEAKKRGRAGGKASGEARRKKRDLRKCLEVLLETEMTDRNGKKMSGAEALSAKLFQSAMAGNVKAFEVLRDTAGQKPVERVAVSEIEQSTIDEIEKIVGECNDKG